MRAERLHPVFETWLLDGPRLPRYGAYQSDRFLGHESCMMPASSATPAGSRMTSRFRTKLGAAVAGALLCLGASFAAFSAAQAAEPLKVAFVYVEPVGDSGWSYQHDIARRALEKQFGTKIKST